MTRLFPAVTLLTLAFVSVATARAAVCTPAHDCAAFSNVQGVVVPLTEERSLEDLVPMIVKGIGKEHGHFDLQHYTTADAVAGPLCNVEARVKFVRERIIRGQKSAKHGMLTLATHTTLNVIQVQRNFRWVLDLKINPERHVSLGIMLPPVENVQPLPRTSLPDVKLPFETGNLSLDMPVLSGDEAKTTQSNHNSADGGPQISTVKRVLAGIIGLLFFSLACWNLHRTFIVRHFGGLLWFFSRLFLFGTLLFVTCVFLDSALFDARIWFLLVR